MSSDTYYFINYAIPLLGLLITLAAQLYINSTYNKYKDRYLTKKNTGAQIARMILDQNDLKNVKVVEIAGNLTDHFDPRKKVVSLSRDIYHGDTIAGASVAAHECGHAIQDKEGYVFHKIRTTIVPVVNFSTKIGYFVIILGIMFGILKLSFIGLIMLSAMLLFQLITLPVEFNASKRAKIQLEKLNIIDNNEKKDSKKMLNAAALTYVASVLTTFLQILRLAMLAMGRRDD